MRMEEGEEKGLWKQHCQMPSPAGLTRIRCSRTILLPRGVLGEQEDLGS